MTPWPEAGTAKEGQLIAVGWLHRNQKLVSGSVSAEFFERFKQLMSQRFIPPALPICVGVDACPFCQFDAAMGNGILFVPDDRRMFVVPELAVHYVAAHHYRPPNEFIEAVSRCPPPRTRDYRVQFLRAGGRHLVSSPQS